jgi:hypothetical protein
LIETVERLLKCLPLQLIRRFIHLLLQLALVPLSEET